MIESAILTDKISILYPIEDGRDTAHHQQVKWEERGPVHAAVRWLRSDKAVEAGNQYATGSIGVTVRYRKELTGRCRVRWQGSVYLLDADPQGTYASGRMDFTATQLDDAQGL